MAYAGGDRDTWVLEWPAQCVIAADNIYWTKEVAAAMEEGKLDKYHKKRIQQLLGLVEILSVVVIVDVHNREVVQQLKDYEVSFYKEFDWTAQLRYYWCPADSIVMKDAEEPLVIKAMVYVWADVGFRLFQVKE